MPVFAIALLLSSAFLHAAWNVLLKQAGEKYLATWWAVLLGSAVFLPFLFWFPSDSWEIGRNIANLNDDVQAEIFEQVVAISTTDNSADSVIQSFNNAAGKAFVEVI